MAGHQGKLGLGEVAVHHVKVGPAYCTGSNLHQNLSYAGLGYG